jgi:hypothetical protein
MTTVGFLKTGRNDIRLSIAPRARIIHGTARLSFAEEDDGRDGGFRRLLQAAGNQCSWTLSASDSESPSAQLQATSRGQEGVKVELEIVWPAPQYLRAEQLAELVAQDSGASLLITLPCPRLGRGEGLPSAESMLDGIPCPIVDDGEVRLSVTAKFS